MKKICKTDSQFLTKIPVRKSDVNWYKNKDSTVTIEMINSGVFNIFFQKFLKKPKISYIHLDEIGSFLWILMDGNRDIYSLGMALEDTFGENVSPLYERLITYLNTLKSCRFIDIK